MSLSLPELRARREGRAIFLLAAPPQAHVAPLRLTTDMTWPRLLRIAWEEGAVPLLRDHVHRHARDVVPLDVQRRLAFLGLECDLRMRALERCAESSLAALASAGIDVVLLKGAALAATVYGSFKHRPMNDLDLLVEPGRAEEARAVLCEAGWMPNPMLPGDSHYGTHHHLPPLIDADARGLRLELHRELLPPGHPFGITRADAWREVRPVRVGGAPAYVLQPTQHALHVAVHFAWSHAMRAGAWHAFRDLGALSHARHLDWDELVQYALRTRASSCCFWTLRLAQTLAALDVPSGILAPLAPSHGERMTRLLERHAIAILTRQLDERVALRLERALWTLAVEPRRLQHGDARPWTVSSDLVAERRTGEPAGVESLRAQFGKVGRSGAHLRALIRA